MRVPAHCQILGLVLLSTGWPLGAAQLALRRYNTSDGLANNGVYSIASDPRGFLWFATGEGLSRFDGFGFANQTTGTGLPHRLVRQVLIGRYGNYWLATPEGLVRFRPDLPQSSAERMLVIRPAGKPEAIPISVLLEDRSGKLWCGTENGLYAMQDTASQTPRLAEIRIGSPGVTYGDAEVSALAEDMEGGLWIGVADGTLYRRLPDGRIERYPTPEKMPQAQITHLLADRTGRIWVGRANSLYRSVPAAHPGANGFELLSKPDGRPPRSRVFDIFESREGDVWVAMYRWLAQFPADGAPARVWTNENGLPSRGVQALGQDRDGNLWMGTADLGAFKLAAGNNLTYSTADGIGMDGVISIAETVRGELYFAGRRESEGFRIAFRSGDGFQAIQPRVPKNVVYFGWRPARVILQDHTGEWWLASSQGLCRYPRLESPSQLAHASPMAVYTTHDGLPGDVVTRLYEDRGGNIWVGTETTKLVFWSRSEQKFVGIRAEGNPSFASAFGEDQAGQVWIGDEEGQLWRVRDGRALPMLGPAKTRVIRGLLLDRAGRLWVATSEGLLRFDRPAESDPLCREYGYSEGLSSLNVYSLGEDRNGSIYIGTGGGVDRLDPNLAHIRHYTSADGIAPGEVIAAYRDRAGALWFGTNHGLTRFVPRNAAANDPPPVWITGLSIEGRRAAVSEAGESSIHGILVQPGEEHLQFDFVGLSYSPGNILRYQYRLGDDPWSAPVEPRSVHYGALAPGKYRFAVRAVNSEGDASLAPATVEFRVSPPLWQRLWFQGSLMALAIAGIIWVQRVRAARLIEIERVRTRIATDLHDDIGSSLSQIAILSEVAHQRSPGGRSGEPIERIGELSRELLDSMGDIVWAIQPHKDHLSDLKQRMRRFAADILSARNIEMHWSIHYSGRDVELTAEFRRQVYLIFKESVNNVARHSQATQAHISLRVVDRQLALEVSDNGCGFERWDQDGGNGLHSMKLRAIRLGGQLQVRSEGGRGTTVLLRAPLPV